MSTSQDLLDLDREVKSATSTLRDLQRQVAVLRARLSVLNNTENYSSDGAESGSSASGEEEFDEGDFKQRPSGKQMCRFGCRCWRPRCWFHHGHGDRMKEVVDMANYWTKEVGLIVGHCASDVAIDSNQQQSDRQSTYTAATESVHRQDRNYESEHCAAPSRALDHMDSLGEWSRNLLILGGSECLRA